MANKRLELDQLLKRAAQSNKDRQKFIEFDSEVLGGKLVFESMPLMRFTDILDRVNGDANNLTMSLEVNCELIYKSCPMLRNKELQEAYDVKEPYDVVPAVFNNNIVEIGRAAECITKMYGLDEAVNQVKN